MNNDKFIKNELENVRYWSKKAKQTTDAVAKHNCLRLAEICAKKAEALKNNQCPYAAAGLNFCSE
jgi:hypothetical protein